MNQFSPLFAVVTSEGIILSQIDPTSEWIKTLSNTGAMGAMLIYTGIVIMRRLDRNDNTTASLARAIWTFLHDNSSNPRIREDAKKEADALSRVGSGNNNGGTGL